MEKRSQLDAFEEFILDEVNEHKMYPSGRVWDNIRTEVQGKRAWPALTIISLTVLVALTVSTFLVTQKQVATTKHLQEKSFTTYHSSAQNTTSKNIKHHNEKPSRQVILVAQNKTATTIYNADTTVTSEDNIVSDEALNIETLNIKASNIETSNTVSLLPSITPQQIHSNILSITAFVSQQKKKKYSVQFYATPTASFRVLNNQKVKELIQPSLIAIPLASPVSQVPSFNEAVRHRSDIGLELGFALSYQLNNKLQFKTGLQLNVRQYQIDTYETAARAATLALVNGGRIQTVSVMSSYNNNIGFRSAHLNNKVYQIAMPIGLDYQLMKFKKFAIHTQASIQPTYNMNKNVYLLSADYANYAAGNDYVRKWNVNTSVGIQFSYQKGNTIWQLGPQIRYQTLPTYNNPYPIKENLIDYGFRIGWSKQFK